MKLATPDTISPEAHRAHLHLLEKEMAQDSSAPKIYEMLAHRLSQKPQGMVQKIKQSSKS